MKAAYAIHELVVNKERITPNSVIELEDAAFAELEALGAVRAAEDDEIAISGLTTSAAPVVEKKLTAAEKKAQKKAEEDAAAAAAKKAEEDAAAVDPDVTEPNGEADLLGEN